MNCLLIYFSITGNTKQIAEAIFKGMEKTGEPCRITTLKDIHGKDLSGFDLIGLGSPVMWQRELANVTNFLEYGLKSVEGKHGFAFCTHGALPGHYLSRVVRGMKQRGMTVIGWEDWFAGVSFPCVPKPYFTDGHPDAIDLQEAMNFGEETVRRGLRITQGETELIPAFPTGKEYDDAYEPVFAGLAEEDRMALERRFDNALTTPFRIDTDKCRYPKCTFCIDNCPMLAIDFTVSPPLFNRSCDLCFACEMACPQGAIEFDFAPYDRLHHVTPGDTALEKSLEIFEARGKFRRLVPIEEIGWETPFWHRPKPRYKISR